MPLLFVIGLLFVSAWPVANLLLPPQSTGELPVSVLFRSGSSYVERAIALGNRVFVIEGPNHRVVVVNGAGAMVGSFGGIGQREGEFYYPADIAVDRNGNIYVLDVGNARVQIFDSAYHFIRQFPITSQVQGMAINSKGEILLGQPGAGKIVSIYESTGRLLRRFGTLRKPSDFYGPNCKSLDKSLATAINRVYILVDGFDNTYVVFLGAPFWQKYDAHGKLLLERRFDFPDTARIISEFGATRTTKNSIKFSEEATPIPFITTGAALDPQSGRLYCAVRWDKMWIVANDTSGNRTWVATLAAPEIKIRNLAFIPQKHALLAIENSPGKFNEVLTLSLPANNGYSPNAIGPDPVPGVERAFSSN